MHSCSLTFTIKKIKCVCRGGSEKRCIQRIKEVIIFFNAKKTQIIVSNKTSLERISLRGKNISGDAISDKNMDRHNINLKNSYFSQIRSI